MSPRSPMAVQPWAGDEGFRQLFRFCAGLAALPVHSQASAKGRCFGQAKVVFDMRLLCPVVMGCDVM